VKSVFRFRRGLTAVEVLVALGIFTVLGTGLYSLFSMSLDQWSFGSGKSESDDTASQVLQSVIRTIEDGKTASSSLLGLAVRLPGKNDQGDYERSLNGDMIYHRLLNGNLYRQVNSTTATVIATGVQSFTYSVVGGNVTLTLTISRQSGMRTSATSFTQRVALRNYSSAS
jgi:prepilin-type N-terminal cleavage/methylation domain-containing protein